MCMRPILIMMDFNKQKIHWNTLGFYRRTSFSEAESSPSSLVFDEFAKTFALVSWLDVVGGEGEVVVVFSIFNLSRSPPLRCEYLCMNGG